MKIKIQSRKADIVFVLRFWREAGWGIWPTIWHAEIKELAPTRDLDERFWAKGRVKAFRIIARQLRRSLKREA